MLLMTRWVLLIEFNSRALEVLDKVSAFTLQSIKMIDDKIDVSNLIKSLNKSIRKLTLKIKVIENTRRESGVSTQKRKSGNAN